MRSPARPEPPICLRLWVVALTIWTPGFFTSANLTNVALQVAVLTIVALGMTLVILTEGIDLSLGPVLGLCGVAAAPVGDRRLLRCSLAVGAALVIGMAFGVLNGTLIAVAGMPPFIVTLGTFGIAQSIATVLTEGDSVTSLPDYFRWFNDGVFARNPGADLGDGGRLRHHLDAALPAPSSAATFSRSAATGAR